MPCMVPDLKPLQTTSLFPSPWHVTDALRDQPNNAWEWDSIVTTKRKVIFMKNQIEAFNFFCLKIAF